MDSEKFTKTNYFFLEHLEPEDEGSKLLQNVTSQHGVISQKTCVFIRVPVRISSKLFLFTKRNSFFQSITFRSKCS